MDRVYRRRLAYFEQALLELGGNRPRPRIGLLIYTAYVGFRIIAADPDWELHGRERMHRYAEHVKSALIPEPAGSGPRAAPAESPRAGAVRRLTVVGRLACGDQQRVVDAAERRRVGEIQQRELIDVQAGPDRGGEHVDALRRALDADDLPAEQGPAASVRDELDPDRTEPG